MLGPPMEFVIHSFGSSTEMGLTNPCGAPSTKGTLCTNMRKYTRRQISDMCAKMCAKVCAKTCAKMCAKICAEICAKIQLGKTKGCAKRRRRGPRTSARGAFPNEWIWWKCCVLHVISSTYFCTTFLHTFLHTFLSCHCIEFCSCLHFGSTLDQLWFQKITFGPLEHNTETQSHPNRSQKLTIFQVNRVIHLKGICITRTILGSLLMGAPKFSFTIFSGFPLNWSRFLNSRGIKSISVRDTSAQPEGEFQITNSPICILRYATNNHRYKSI